MTTSCRTGPPQKAFLKRESASADFERSPEMRESLIQAFLHHYHPDPSTGHRLLNAEDICGAVVTAHPEWKSPCFGLLLKDGGEPERFSIGKKRFRSEPRPSALAPATAPHTRPAAFAYEALRAAVQVGIDAWAKNTPLPERCPVTGEPLGPLSDRTDQQRNTLPSTPSIDHYEPSFRELTQTLLQSEQLTLETLPLKHNPEFRRWEFEGDGLCKRWLDHHATGKLRWVSHRGQGELNQRDQRERLAPNGDHPPRPRPVESAGDS